MNNADALVETQSRIDGLHNGVNAHEMCLRHLLADPRGDDDLYGKTLDLARHNKELKYYKDSLEYYEYILKLLKSKEEK